MSIQGIRSGSGEITRSGAFDTSRGTNGNFTDIVSGTRDAFTRTSRATDADGNLVVSRTTQVERAEDGSLSFHATIQGPDGQTVTRDGTLEKTDAGTYTAHGTLTGKEGATFQFSSSIDVSEDDRTISTEISGEQGVIADVSSNTVRDGDELTRTTTVTDPNHRQKSKSSTVHVTGLSIVA
ncbi:MAG: hypothetical protein U0610_22180 [bacterium]